MKKLIIIFLLFGAILFEKANAQNAEINSFSNTRKSMNFDNLTFNSLGSLQSFSSADLFSPNKKKKKAPKLCVGIMQSTSALSDLGIGIGFGVVGDYALTMKNKKKSTAVVSAGFNFYIPKVITGTSIEPLTSSTITTVETITLLQGYVNGKYYFGTSLKDNFGFYGLVGISFYYLSDKTKTTTIIAGSSNISDNNLSAVGPTIDFGVGMHLKLGPGLATSEITIGLPANEANGEAIDNPIPASFNFSLGYKYPLLY